MTALLGIAMAAVVLLYFWHEAKPFVVRHMELAERKLSIEAQATLKPPIVSRDPMPDDLLQYVEGQPKGWVRDDAKRRVDELYDEHRDWNKVRNAIAVEEYTKRQEAQSALEGYGPSQYMTVLGSTFTDLPS